MNSQPSRPHRRGAPLAACVIELIGLLALGAGCAHQPVVIETPATVVVQAPVTVAPPAPIPAVVVMKDAPPPPRFEQTPPQPSRDSVWIAGYWFWREGRQEWIAGHWTIPPRVGATWVPPRWEKRDDSFVFFQGYWQ